MLQRYPDQFIQVGQYRTRYWQVGSQGSPVILVHGLSGAVEYWSQTIGALAMHHRVFALDLLGFGQTDKPKVIYDIDFLAAFLYDFVLALGLKAFDLVGHSLGGAVSLIFAGEHPEMIEHLVLVSSAGLTTKVPMILRLLSLPWIGEIMATPSRTAMARNLRMISVQKQTITSDLIDTLYEYMASPGGKAAFLSVIRTNMSWAGIPSERIELGAQKLLHTHFPVMVIWGKQDLLLPFLDAEPMLERFSRAEVYLLEGCGHIPQIEQAQKFNAKLLAFLS